MSNRLSVLLLADDSPAHAGTILQHIGGLSRRSRHKVRVFNPRFLTGTGSLDLDEFDAVIIHYTLVVTYDSYFPPDLREKVRRFQGPKLQFIQDDYRWVNEIAETIRDLGVDVLLTLVPERAIPRVWSDERLPRTTKVQTLAGYVPPSYRDLRSPPLDERPIDVGYRGRTLPYWLGRLGQEKVQIGEGFLERAAPYGLRCDIAWSESDRIYGPAWLAFIGSCRATLGTESGASITDFDGSIERATEEYLSRNPDADFEEVFAEVLEPYEGNVMMNVISPRIFEAAALRTPLILFPGEYGGVVQPREHYILLEKDFSNMDEVVARLRDTPFLTELAARTHQDLIASGRYSIDVLVRQVDDVIERLAPHASARRFPVSYFRARAGAALRRPSAGGARRELANRRVAAAWAAAKVVVPVRDYRSLVVAWARSTPARRTVRFRDLARDLVVLAIIRRAQQERHTTGAEPFHVRADRDDESGRLVLTSEALSRPYDVSAARTWNPTRVVLWNHEPVDSTLLIELTRSRSVRLRLSEGDSHQFSALGALALFAPESVERAVVGTLDAAPAPTALSLLRWHWRFAASVSVAVALELLPRHGLAWFLPALVRAWPARLDRPRALLAELARLALLVRASREGENRTFVRFAGDKATFTTVSQDDDVVSGDSPSDGDVTLVWDHSRVGETLVLASSLRIPFVIGVGPGGIFEGVALEPYLRAAGRGALQQLARAARALPQPASGGDEDR